jgi:hypothetical protein
MILRKRIVIGENMNLKEHALFEFKAVKWMDEELNFLGINLNQKL